MHVIINVSNSIRFRRMPVKLNQTGSVIDEQKSKKLLENSGLIQKMRIAGVGVQELQMRNEWVDGYEIRVSIENGEAVISANREGLLSLAKQMTALAEETPGSHYRCRASVKHRQNIGKTSVMNRQSIGLTVVLR